MRQVEIFKTNICNSNQSAQVIQLLSERFPEYKVNFDLDDCDRILRIETVFGAINDALIKQLLASAGYFCQELPD